MRFVVCHPGSMGASVGAALAAAGNDVLWVREGRRQQTAERAAAAGLRACATLDEALAAADVVVSVCPPDAALEVARQVSRRGFDGFYLDANAVAPGTAAEVAAEVERAGASYVDGGIVGPPAWTPGTTRLYLSGPHAGVGAAWFSGGPFEAVTVAGGPQAASALKMVYAGWSKGSTALLAATRALAREHGVEDALLAEWATSVPGLGDDSADRAGRAAPKAWRWVGEMREIASTFRAAGLPGGFHDAAAEVYARLDGFKDTDGPDPAAVVEALRPGTSAPRPGTGARRSGGAQASS